jgi:plasmid stabilization system protein ParE
MEIVRPLKLSVTPRAFRHLSGIKAYIARDSPSAAQQVGARIHASIEFLQEFPGVGHVGRRSDTLEWPIPDLPYIIIYRASRTTLEVVGIYHGAQKHRT